ncbi:MAG: energy transducer TonB [Candidatus Omnitrophota bacterium]|nr:energy transducer TonB [Candidatus Omnitrophota bacterium]
MLYYQDVRGKILNAAMKYALESQSKISGEAIVSFSLSSDGALTGDPALVNEVQPELAEVALRSVKDSAPFPPFPKLLRRDTENFKIRISFE